MEALGTFEELIMLLLLQEEEATGATMVKKFNEQLDRSVSLAAVHIVLKRLTKKNLVESRMGEPTQERGGKRQRLYSATKQGAQVVRSMQQERQSLWKLIPNKVYEK